MQNAQVMPYKWLTTFDSDQTVDNEDLVVLGSAYNGTTTTDCDLECTDEDYPVCAMEVRVNKKIFSNDCVMWRENECNGGQYQDV
ncbi:unnamed protein product [Nezara viridula]|uniref:Kazal-like domain-containing protein n=1 Tax=Nezara viridula TaxID=85310 RepID=A0A9P0HS64_NEZVI|nr:unnamed protein product [Nezara viridula]